MIISSQSLRALFVGFKTVFQQAFDGGPAAPVEQWQAGVHGFGCCRPVRGVG